MIFSLRRWIMGVKPLGDRVLLKPLEAEEKTKGGIVIPDTAKEKPQQGRVEEVGSGRINDEGKVKPLEVKKGQKVLYGKYSGTEVTYNSQDFLILREDDILAILE